MNLKRTALYEEHVKLKGKLVDFAGWEMPVQYKSVKDEVIQVRTAVGAFDVSHMGEFWVTGPDAENFVDYLVTNDLKAAAWGKAVYSPLCRENGTVIDDLIVYKLKPGKILICVNASNTEKDWQWMNQHKNSFKIEFQNASDDFSLIALQGPKAFETLKKLVSKLPELEYYSAAEIENGMIVARTGYTGEDGFEIFLNHGQAKEMWQKMMELGVTPCGLAARDVLRMEVCYPLYGHEITDEVTPYDAGLNWTVKKNKERFIGKEALLNQKPQFKTAKFISEKGVPREGYRILDENQQEVGVVVSGTMSVTLNMGIAIARMKAAAFSPEKKYFVEIRQSVFPLKLTTTPFVQGGVKK
jgi:aminomethyltransferase